MTFHNSLVMWRGCSNVFRHACLLLLLSTLASCDYKPPFSGELPHGMSGRVTNAVTGEVIVGATVSIQGQSALTHQDGFYSFGDLKDGAYPMKVTHTDYISAERMVTISENAERSDFQLQPK